MLAIACWVASGSLTILPAYAHDQLVESVPAAGAQLGVHPEQIALRYSADLIPLGTEVRVTDEQGRDWVDGPPAVTGRTVTQPLQQAPTGGQFTVRWRVVSSDGHPISGRQSYSVAPAVATRDASTPAVTPTAAGAAPTDDASPGAADSLSATLDSSAVAVETSPSPALPLLPWIGGLVALGAAGAVAWRLFRTRSG